VALNGRLCADVLLRNFSLTPELESARHAADDYVNMIAIVMC